MIIQFRPNKIHKEEETEKVIDLTNGTAIACLIACSMACGFAIAIMVAIICSAF